MVNNVKCIGKEEMNKSFQKIEISKIETSKEIEKIYDYSNRESEIKTLENSIKEFSAGMEFNFLDFDLHDGRKKISPYVFTGVNYFIYEEIYILNNESEKDYQSSTFAIPMIVGVKARLFDNFIFI